MKYFRIIFAVATLALTIIVVSSRIPNNMESPRKLQIVTTIFPLYDFTRSVGRDKVNVSLLIPPGTEIHNFEPKPSDILKIQRADIFVYTGTSMEPWVEDIMGGISGSKMRVVDVSIGITMSPDIAHEEDVSDKQMDPHIWLDFENDRKIVQIISQSLAEKDPPSAQSYTKNASELRDKLAHLDTRYKRTLSHCRTNHIVYGGHYAFGYMARRYSLTYTAVQGFSPDSQPTPQDLIRLVNEIKDNDIQYVFYEELTSPKIAETLASETGAELLLLNTAHNISKEDLTKGVSFVSIMENNLKKLEIGLGCEKVETLSTMSSR